MKKMKYIILIIILLTLSGCVNYEEINSMAIVSAVSIDKCKNNKSKYNIGVQIMNAKKKENESVSEITYYEACGNSVYEAIQKISLESPKRLYLGHNGVIVIGEELLKEQDPINYLDYFLRESEVEKDAIIAMSKGDTASDVLKILTPLETIPSKNLKSTLFNSTKTSGLTHIISLDEFISYLINDGEEAIIPSIKIVGKTSKGEENDNLSTSNPDTKLRLSNIGVLNNNKLVGYLDSDESSGYNIISNEAKNTYINFKCDDKNYASAVILNSKTKETLTFKNNKPYVILSQKATVNIAEYNCDTSFINNKDIINNIEKEISKKIKSNMVKVTNILYKTYVADSFGYGSKYEKRFGKKIKSLGYNSSNIKQDITFKISSKVTINSTELTIKSIIKEDNNE